MGEAFSKIELQRNLRDGNSIVSSRQTSNEWQRAFTIVVKQWRWAALFAVATIVIVTAVTLAMKPVYEPTGRLQIDPPGSEVFSLNAAGTGLIDTGYITTEAEKLRTDDLALATIRALHLDTNPDIVGKPSALTTTASTSDQLTPGENVAVRNFQSRLSIRLDSSNRLVGVAFASHNPQLSADVVNTLMKLLVQKNFEARTQAIAESSKWLSRQLDDIRDKMEVATSALADFAAKSGIADVDANSNTYAEKIGNLNRQLVQAEADRIQFQTFLISSGNPDSLPQVRNNTVIQTLTQKLAEINAQLAQSRVIYGPKHVEVRKLQNQVDELQRQVATQRQSIVSELSTNYRAAKEREKLLKGEVRAATTDLATLAQYDALKREVQADRQLYDSLYAKIKEAGISAASKSSNIHIVNQARVLDHPTRPHRALNILAGVLTGLIGGVVLAFVKDRWEDRIYTTEDIRASAGLPSITVVPVIQASHNKTAIWDRAGTSLALPRTERPGYPVGPDCFVLQRPNAPESEAVHTLWTMLFLSHSGNCPKTILITSPLPGEGKTTLVNNLAVALTNHGRTCLVDADLRKPMVSTRFKLSPVTGLEHYLQGTATLNQIKCSSEVKNLTIVPSIKATDGAIQLLTGDAIRTLVAGLREQFDFVIIDTPPILPYADGLALSTLVDGVILVGRAGQTPRGAVMRGIELLGSVNSAPILAVVLNAANQRPDYSGYSNRFAFE